MAEYGIEERFREIRTTNGGRTHESFASSSAALIGFFGNEASNDGMSLLSGVLRGYLSVGEECWKMVEFLEARIILRTEDCNFG